MRLAAPPPACRPEALAAQPRALPLRSGPDRLVRAAARPAAFALDPRGTPREALEALAALPGARLSAYQPADLPEPLPEPELLLLCELGTLEGLAGGVPLAGALLAAQAALDAPPGEPELMGVLNVTPDSFSDGGLFLEADPAIERGLALEAEGARWVDVGGESTRPGAEPVPAGEELARVLPVVAGLARRLERARISIDTTKAAVARAALDAGAGMINDVSAGRGDPAMLPLAAERGVPIVLMHAQGEPRRMQVDPRYGDVVADVARFLRERIHAAWKAGVEPRRIVVDPGIGFGKRLRHNLALLRRLPELLSLACPLLVGPSRKSFIAHLSGAERQEDWRARERTDRPETRLGGTAAAVACAVQGGASILRVHDVRAMAEAARVARALARPEVVPNEVPHA